jgi:hypothetical protein
MLSNLSNENFLEETEKYTNSLLHKKDDVQKIISISIEHSKEEKLNELVFTAKYVKGLLRILNKAPGIPEVENIEHVKEDMTENMKKVVEQLRDVLADAEESTLNSFEERYFSLNQNSFNNLNLLLADLESVKKYLNHLKHSQ